MSDENNQTPVETGAEQPIETTIENPVIDNASGQEPDYKKKFSESSKEALRLLEEKKEKERLLAEKEAEIERLKAIADASASGSYADTTEDLYPGFNDLSEEQQKELLAFKRNITRETREEIFKDPAISFAKQVYNEKKWNDAFEVAVEKFPELRESKDEFKQKFYNPNNVPDNISDILQDLSKIFLFDRAKDLGAKEAQQKAEFMDIERAGGGDKTPTAKRSLADWQRMAQENPRKFASLSKEYNEDISSGKL